MINAPDLAITVGPNQTRNCPLLQGKLWVTANRQALQALRIPRSRVRNWINQLLPPGITCTLCRSSDSPQAARHHSTFVSFMTCCIQQLVNHFAFAPFVTHCWAAVANNLGLAWDKPNRLTPPEHRVHSFRSRHNRVRHRAAEKNILGWLRYPHFCVRLTFLRYPDYLVTQLFACTLSHLLSPIKELPTIIPA